MACSDFELCILSAGRSMVADAANHWYADAAKNLYVYLADLDVQKCRQIKTKVIIAIFKNKQQYLTQPDNFQSGCVFFYLLLQVFSKRHFLRRYFDSFFE